MPTQLFEYVASNASLKVDREAGLLRSVKILGHISANGYEYQPAAIARAARLYDGKVVNFNHPSKPSDPRSSYDRFGWLSGIQVKEDGLYGDLHYLKSHPFAAPVLEAAERNPALFGMSHVAHGDKRQRGSRVVVEDIESVSSVDLVSDPATVKGLFESYSMSQKTTVREVLKHYLGSGGGVHSRQIEAFTLLEQDMPMGAEMAAPEAGMDSTAQAHEAFKAMVIAVLDDTALDMKGMLSKIKEILKAKEKLMGGGESSSETPEEGGEMPAEESKKVKPTETQLQERVTRMERRDAVRLLCDADQFIPSPVQMKALAALTEEADVKALIEDLKGGIGIRGSAAPGSGRLGKGSATGAGITAVKPKSAAPSSPALTEQIKLPKTREELKAFILN